ncbi:Endonuclease/exonuclease/phosphatase [Suillus occidentalis]|nr:Endonuclease/exonuclease/phosphatase [Suillus occidentalis]
MEQALKKKRKRANFILATQNIRGQASLTLGPSPISKWTTINHLMREKKLGILCVQETHLLNEHITSIDNIFSRRLKVLNSSDPDQPGNSAGVAFVINKELVENSNYKMLELIPGRAIVLTIHWHQNQPITILNIYAPNAANEHPLFWETIQKKWEENELDEPDFMVGDFNLTEDPIDRAPARPDNENATNALRDLRQKLNIQDTWRLTFPTARAFTFASNVNSLSRLDRIYTHPRHDDSLIDWATGPSTIPSDHNIVQVKFAPPNTPHIGKGRWTWPLGLLNEKNLIEYIVNSGIEMEERLTAQNNMQNERNDTQTLWEDFKIKISEKAKRTAKSHLAKINQRINQLQKDINQICNETAIDNEENKRIQKMILESEIQHLEHKKYKNSKLKAQATWNIKGETISKYWSKINNPRKPRDIIPRLRIPGSNRIVTRSDKMAELAKEYHESI